MSIFFNYLFIKTILNRNSSIFIVFFTLINDYPWLDIYAMDTIFSIQTNIK